MHQSGVPSGRYSLRWRRNQCSWLLANGSPERFVLRWLICRGFSCIRTLGPGATRTLVHCSKKQADLRDICLAHRCFLLAHVAHDISDARF